MSDHPLVDSYGRAIRTLRISLTDQCNFRCVYCMPPEGLPTLPRSDYLTIDEMVRFARLCGDLGVRRVRLTGGEPLLRKDVVEIVGALKRVATVRDLSMTTNGSLLGRLAERLRLAGLDRLNVSLDSLDAARFAEVSRFPHFERVRDGIQTALDLGFPVKLNVVVMKGMPDDEILAFVALAVRQDIDVRFLEFMPLCGSGWEADRVYPIAGVRDVVRSRFELAELERGDRPAQAFTIRGGRGRVGFIASLSEPFCGDCSRMRLTADGKIRPCLFSNEEYPIGQLLRARAPDAEIIRAIRDAVWRKPWGSEFAEKPFRANGNGRDAGIAHPFIRTIGG
jgi:cyclic pyranopterin phosphate synthase